MEDATASGFRVTSEKDKNLTSAKSISKNIAKNNDKQADAYRQIIGKETNSPALRAKHNGIETGYANFHNLELI